MLAYALIQEMPNGWWKGLVSGWHGLPEQFALSHEGIIREMTSVANEYAKERTDRGMPVPASHPARLEGWRQVPISLELGR